MSPPKLIVVLGATGQQGGSVVDTFVKEGPIWQVRGVTRNSSSTKAHALAKRGVQVVEANMSSPSTLHAAFQDANVIFAVSDFLGLYFAPENKDKPKPGQALNAWAAEEEAQQLKNVIDAAAKLSTLERLVFSSLSNATKWSKGKYTHVFHFDGKASAEEYGRVEQPKLWAKTSVLQAGIFLNFFTRPGCQPRKSADGAVEFICPWDADLKLPWLVPDEDTGPLVRALVHGDPGQNLLGYRGRASTREIAAMFSAIFNLQSRVRVVPQKQFWAETFSPDLVEEFTEFINYWEEFGFEAQESPPIIHPSDLPTQVRFTSISDWIAKQTWDLQ